MTINIRYKRWGIGLAGAAAVYSAAGFWLLPHIIRSQLPAFAKNKLERRGAIGAVSFNPLTLRLEASDIRLDEADGAPLFAVGRLAVELDWRSLFKRAWSLAEIRIDAPVLSLAIAPDGRFNIAELIATLNRDPQPPSPGMPRLLIRHFALGHGKVDLRDRRAGYADTFTPIDLALDNLSTLPGQDGELRLAADAAHGGKLRWTGKLELAPLAGSGVLELDKVALPGLAGYLKSATRAALSDGALSAKLPYRYAYADGRFDASLDGASLALRDLALRGADSPAPFATLKLFELSGVGADLGKHSVSIAGLRIEDGVFNARRDARGTIDLAALVSPPSPATAAPSAKPENTAPAANWKVQLKQLGVERLAFHLSDESAHPAMSLDAGDLSLHLALDAEQAASGLQLRISDAAFGLGKLALHSGTSTPFSLAHIGFIGGAADLAAKTAGIDTLTAEGGQFDLARDATGQLTLLSRLPVFASQAPAGKVAAKPAEPAGPAWNAQVRHVRLAKFGLHFNDATTGIDSSVQDLRLNVDGAGSDLKQPLAFDAGLALKSGGQLTARGRLVPASGAVDAEVQVSKLALAPVQPLLGRYVKLKLAGGVIDAKGKLSTGAGDRNHPTLRYAGAFGINGLVLNEDDGDLFASWKTLGAEQLKLTLGPNLLDIPELRIAELNTKLMIENDRSLNAARLLVTPPAPASVPASAAPPLKTAAATPADTGFPVRVRRLRLQNAKLDFTDLSLRPQFGARIHELNGVITGLSTRSDARSQIELDGNVDDYGLARVRGELNPFVPADNTDLNVIFKNVDMVSASPYSMKFAGYRIAEGKISLDLQYKVRNSQLEGQNHIVLDKLRLGERIDSPDALHLPLELALAILKDSDGRIDLGLPVSGNMSDPQFSYGALVWKTLGNVLGKVVSSPFRALGNLLGVNADKMEAVEFDAGSAVLLPPEREKLRQVAALLAKREQLALAVPAQYSEAADGAALRQRALRRDVTARAGIRLAAGEEAGPLSYDDRKIRGALRDLYAERFGAAELDKQKKAAESATPSPKNAADGTPAPAGDTQAVPKKLPVWQRLGKLVQGEPQVADAGAFYARLQQRLEQNEALPPDALPALGAARGAAILAALKDAGTAPASVRGGAPEKIEAEAGQPVALKLGLAAK